MQDRIITSKHNQPPTDAEALADKLYENSRADIYEIDSLLATPVIEVIANEDQAKQADEVVDSVKSLRRRMEATHRAEKAPYLELGRVVDKFFKTKVNDLEGYLAKVNVARTVYLNAKAEEERRLVRERAEAARLEAERLAEEAKAHEDADIKDTAEELISHAVATENKAEHLQEYADKNKASKFVKGLRVSWTGEIEDIGAVDLNTLRPYLAEEHVQTAINKFVRDGGRQLPGVKIYQKSEAK